LLQKDASWKKRGALRRVLRCSKIATLPLLRGNSVSAEVSVLVPLATNKHPQGAALLRASLINREETCAN
jgi:hypothetical protein